MSGGDHSRAHTNLVNAACVELSRIPGVDVDAPRQGAKGAQWHVGLRNGTPDLCIRIVSPRPLPALCLWAEAKTGAAVLSEDQERVHAQLNRVAPGTAIVFRSVEALVALVLRIIAEVDRIDPDAVEQARARRAALREKRVVA